MSTAGRSTKQFVFLSEQQQSFLFSRSFLGSSTCLADRMEAAHPLAIPQLPDASSPAALQRKQVHFGRESSPSAPAAGGKQQGEPSPVGKAAAAGASLHAIENELFSPGPQRQGSWTIEAQRSGRMELGDSSTPASSAAAYTPASASYLESARKVDDLCGRLESLEQALKDMESKAVAHLDKQLQEKVLATAAKIVTKRFINDKELDKKLQVQILQTAMKVVKRQSVAAQAAAAVADEEANPTRRLKFEQGGSGGGNVSAAGVQQYIAHIEQGLGEVVRRLERKVDTVASLLDQNALELLEARLASGLVSLETRLDVMEEAHQLQQRVATPSPAAGADSSHLLLERVVAMEEAMAEQGRAVADLLAVLRTHGALAAAQEAAAPQPANAAAVSAAVRSTAEDAQPTAEKVASRQPELAQPPPLAQQLHQRRSALVKRSVLGNPGRSAAAPATASLRSALPRLKTTHAAGTAQQIAIATAREQLAKQATRAQEEAEAETPAWVTMFYVFGWTVLALLGLAAIAAGALAVLVKEGRLSESDLAFVFK